MQRTHTAGYRQRGGDEGDFVTEWRGIEGKKHSTNSDISFEVRRVLWHLPARYDSSQSSAFLLTQNHSSCLPKSIIWSMVSKAAERLSIVKCHDLLTTEYHCGF